MKPIRKPLVTVNQKTLWDTIRNHGRVLGGQVSFGAQAGTNKEPDRNIQCSKASGTTPASANTQFAVAHTLGRVPVTFFGHTNNGGVLFAGTSPWTKTQAFLECTTASAAYSIVFI